MLTNLKISFELASLGQDLNIEKSMLTRRLRRVIKSNAEEAQLQLSYEEEIEQLRQ